MTTERPVRAALDAALEPLHAEGVSWLKRGDCLLFSWAYSCRYIMIRSLIEADDALAYAREAIRRW